MEPPRTPRSVAARRLEYERAAAPYGDPGADEILTSDVAAGLTPARGRMHEYIRARTAFFDRAVVRSIAQGITNSLFPASGPPRSSATGAAASATPR